MKTLYRYLTFNKRYLALWITVFLIASYFALTGSFDVSSNTILVYSAAYAAFTAIPLLLVTLLKVNRDIKKSALMGTVTVLAFILGFSHTCLYINNIREAKALFADSVTVQGIVKSEPHLSSSQKSYEIDVRVYATKTQGKLKKPLTIKVFADKADFDQNISVGSNILCTVSSFSSKPAFKGAFDYGEYLLQNNIICSAYTKTVKTDGFLFPEEYLSPIETLGLKLRHKILIETNKRLPSDESALLSGILVGDRDGFSDKLYDNFSNSGFMHIAAVSGMHTSYLYALILFISEFLKLPKRYVCIPTIPLLILFAAVSLFTPSVCRAVIMLSVTLSAYLLTRKPDSITSLAVAALIIVLNNPYNLKSASFLMSFGATLAILVFYKPISSILLSLFRLKCKGTKKPKSASVELLQKVATYIVSSVSLSLCGTLGLSYFTAKFFGGIQLGGIFGSIVVLPVVALVFILGYINCFVSFIHPLSSFISACILKPALLFINKCAEFFATGAFRIRAPYPPQSFFAVFIVVCIGIYILLLPAKNAAKRH